MEKRFMNYGNRKSLVKECEYFKWVDVEALRTKPSRVNALFEIIAYERKVNSKVWEEKWKAESRNWELETYEKSCWFGCA